MPDRHTKNLNIALAFKRLGERLRGTGQVLTEDVPATRECPHCRGSIDSRATACMHCGRDVEPLVFG